MKKNIFQKISTGIITGGVAIAMLFVAQTSPAVGATIPISTAVFQTSLQNSIGASDTSMTLVNGTNKAGTSLSGYMCFNIDEGTSLEEFVCGTASDTSVTSMLRGIDPVDGDLEVAGLKKAHRRGATVKITDYPSIGILSRILNGVETIPNILSYTSAPTFTPGSTQIATVGYADGLAIAGSPNASTTTKGISEEATQAEIDAGTAAGGTAARLFVNPSTLATSIYSTRLPSSGEKSALAGTSGTPGSGNKYITENDVSSAGASGKVVRLNGTAYPAADGTAITGVIIGNVTQTASGAIAQNDSVYTTAADTVKSFYPTAQGTAGSISTAASHQTSTKALPLSTNGLYLHVTGGDETTSAPIYAQVRTINAAETNFSNGSEQTVYSTGAGSRKFNVTNIGTDKFLIAFQADTAGAAAGIKAVVISISGTTVTVGSVATIESTGSLASHVAVGKADVDKGVVYYGRDSDSDLYAQVLSVSGTTITTNTPALVKAGSHTWKISASQLATNSNILIYQDNTTGIMYGKVITISGIIPSVGSEQTIVNTSANYYLQVNAYSSTKALLMFSEQTTPTNNQASILTISGSTITKGSNLALQSARTTRDFGFYSLSTSYALVADYGSNTSQTLYILDLTGSTPTSASSQNIDILNTSNLYMSAPIVKVAPWTYMIGAVSQNGNIVKLTVPSSARIGIASASISNAATGTIYYRYQARTLSGITLTPGSVYYVDDNGQPTVNSSLTAPTLGIAINTTKLLIQ